MTSVRKWYIIYSALKLFFGGVDKDMLIHICELCGYEYNPKIGDPDNGIGEETYFEELPEDWTCPLCGAGKEDFTEEVRDDDSEEL